MTSPDLWLAVAGLALHGIAVIIAGVWQLGKARDEVLTKLSAHKEAIAAELASERRVQNEALAVERRVLSETIAALRQRINDVELEGFKTFVRRDTFYEITRQIQEGFNLRVDKLESKFDRIIEMRRRNGAHGTSQ